MALAPFWREYWKRIDDRDNHTNETTTLAGILANSTHNSDELISSIKVNNRAHSVKVYHIPQMKKQPKSVPETGKPNIHLSNSFVPDNNV